MTQTVLGPKGSPRRRWTLLLPLTLALVVGLFYAAGAQAVHDDGNIALEGNATSGNECSSDANNAPVGCDPHNPLGITTGEDWDDIFAGTDTADESSGIVTDTTLSGGLAGQGDSILPDNTKDIQPISGPGSWAWKQTTTTSVQDKADLEHAYAAQYGDELYFGADRNSNSGDTVMGFWFFREEIGKVGPDANGNGTFTGNHTARGQLGAGERGDLLIVSDFRQGGKAPQIQVYEWVTSGGSAATNLDLVGGSDTNPPTPRSCTQAPGEKNNDPPVPPVANGDPLCATANQFIVTAPWNYDAKSNSGGTTGNNGTGKFGVATLMEGGIDLAAFGFGDTCFSSFMAETRSSHSVTSTLSDFVLGGFGGCTASLTTTPANGTGTNLTDSDNPTNGLPDIQIGAGSAGIDVTDNASLTVTGVGTWCGTVSFFICGPIASGTCDTGGVPAGTKNVSNAATTATSNVVNLTSVGRYCWRGFFDSATTGVPDSTDATTGECFEVKPRQSTLDTAAVASPVAFGQAVQDNATLGNTANQPGTNGGFNSTYTSINATNGAAAGGKITFTLLKADCSTVATGTGTNPQDFTPITGNGTYGPVSFTPDTPGTYHWKAQYFPAAGDVNNLGSTHNAACGDSDETVVVQQIATQIRTAPFTYPQDSASIKADSGNLPLGGSVEFKLFGPAGGFTALANCTTNNGTGLVYSETKSNVVTAPAGNEVTGINTNNTSFSIASGANGTYVWRVTYTPGASTHTGRASVCVESTAVTQTNAAYPGTLHPPAP